MESNFEEGASMDAKTISSYGSKLINWVRYDEERYKSAEEKAISYARSWVHTHEYDENVYVKVNDMAILILADFQKKYEAGRPANIKTINIVIGKCPCGQEFQIGPKIANKIRRGERRICRACKGTIVLIEEGRLKVLLATGQHINEETLQRQEMIDNRDRVVVNPGEDWKHKYNEINKDTINTWYKE